jgi:hypothetical protein
MVFKKGNQYGKMNVGRIISEETKLKISNKLKGKIFSQEYRKKLSESGKKHKRTEEHKKNISKSKIGMDWESLYGKERAEEMKLKMSKRVSGINNPHYGIPMDKALKERLRVINTGKVSKNKGKHLSEETKRKLSESIRNNKYERKGSFKKGHKTWITGIGHSEETKRKLSE